MRSADSNICPRHSDREKCLKSSKKIRCACDEQKQRDNMLRTLVFLSIVLAALSATRYYYDNPVCVDNDPNIVYIDKAGVCNSNSRTNTSSIATCDYGFFRLREYKGDSCQGTGSTVMWQCEGREGKIHTRSKCGDFPHIDPKVNIVKAYFGTENCEGSPTSWIIYKKQEGAPPDACVGESKCNNEEKTSFVYICPKRT
ncbi:hypothetical protein PROFUN_04232 [Planoprotostelium fungivorum]|uniref:Uncharacterized protein n=1 Tax=Planoprotostelium fungivorum TaxID=1890364 RepID=A0A2P6NVZ8_9EUKA|nr:hypothetical protein PROFUN_04232 [Planoprotostelium fungivorum]